ncbi:MAG: hypothetical protein N2111_01825 [Candidatus Sumerlaeaceae bacterium]|nr:hypothetical protein [Candidatus Sumerlaeaceae bacterium]
MLSREIYLKIARPRNTCAKCGAAIAAGGKHPSVLAVVPDDDDEAGAEPLREDFCEQCWPEVRERGYYGFWIARREPPKPDTRANKRERNAILLSYFDWLAQDAAANAQRLYVISHLLMKFQVFKWLRTDRDDETGAETVTFRNTATDEEVSVTATPPDEEAVAAIVDEINRYLDRGPDPEPAAPGAESGGAAASPD